MFTWIYKLISSSNSKMSNLQSINILRILKLIPGIIKYLETNKIYIVYIKVTQRIKLLSWYQKS